MAIAPLSDIVLDVAGAADPVRRQEAIERLGKLSGVPINSAPAFLEVLGAHASQQPASSAGSAAFLQAGNHFGLIDGHKVDQTKVYQKFEAVFLQNFVESILPKDADLFGDAASADICRSMMAEQLAQQIAKTGKLGIASKILAAHPPAGSAHQAAAVSVGILPAIVGLPSGLVQPGPPDIDPIHDGVSSTLS